MRTLPGLVGLLLLAVPMTGCIGNVLERIESPPADLATVADAIFASGDDHDHYARVAHGQSFNVEVLDHLLLDELGTWAGGMAMDLHEDKLFIATGYGRVPKVWVVDISDPTQLTILGTWSDPEAVGGDRMIAVSEDGRFAFLGNEGSDPLANAAVRMLDVSDPADIQLVDLLPVPRGAHTVETITIDGAIFVFAIDYGVNIIEVVEGPMGPRMVSVGRYTVLADGVLLTPSDRTPQELASYYRLALIGHDMRAMHDPELGPLLYVAYAHQGLHILDISDPRTPIVVSKWLAPHEPNEPWYTHTVAVEVRDGQRLAIVGPEAVDAYDHANPSPYWVVDLTDITEPELLATWTNPAGAPAESLMFSAHWARLENGYAHLAHYHGGAWVLDVSTPERQRAPEVVAAFAPAPDIGWEPAPDCCGRIQPEFPHVVDVETKDGVTYVLDFVSGLHAIRAAGL